MSAALAPLTADAALAELAGQGISAVRVQTLKELVERHRAVPTRTIRFEKRERDGWTNECFAPSWFAIDGVAKARPAAPPRIGSDAPAILAELGYTAADVERLQDTGIVGAIEWYQRSAVATT
jgi:crotonobetainyl-CoA:carnitine CoA-transferase CaiB-like acyl-CoA transferase